MILSAAYSFIVNLIERFYDVTGGSIKIDGTDIEIVPDSVCVHGDNVKALTFVTKIRAALEAEGVEIAPLRSDG